MPSDAPTPPHPIATMRKRPEYLACARAKRQGTKGMLVQARRRTEGDAGNDIGDDSTIRVGFTCSKKVGNAVARNRAKRRLREIARLLLPTHGQPGWDYVLIGNRDNTGSRDFAALQSDFLYALRKLHG